MIGQSAAYVIKTARAETIAPEVRALIHEVAPEAPMYRSYTMAALAARSMIQLSFALLTLGMPPASTPASPSAATEGAAQVLDIVQSWFAELEHLAPVGKLTSRFDRHKVD